MLQNHFVAAKNSLAIALAAALCAGAGQAGAAAAPGQLPILAQPGATDLGPAPADELHTLTFTLQMRNRADLVAYITSTTDRISPNFRKFLTPAQFKTAYGQPDAVVAQVVALLQSHGLTVNKVYKNNLLVTATGTNAQLGVLFGSPIHQYSVTGQTFEQPVGQTSIPNDMTWVVAAVNGLSTQSLSHVHPLRSVGSLLGKNGALKPGPNLVLPTPAAPATGTFGSYTVADFANRYNVNPLYARGLTGKGTTIGIIGLAQVDPANVYAYWASLGLNVAPNRIQLVPVDGGADPDLQSDGSIEATMDLQQAGGVAPGANLVLYHGPSTAAAFLDVMAQAAEDNLVDTVSTSWDNAEALLTGDTLDAVEAVLLQLAAQGIPFSTASGDGGAYELNRAFGRFANCSSVLSIGFPASSPWVLAVGGTTLGDEEAKLYGSFYSGGPGETVWSLQNFRDAYVQLYGQADYSNIWPGNTSGGGVSVHEAVPSYQAGLTGVKTSARGQSLFCPDSSNRMQRLLDMPGGFAGRNVPDVSLNATGYLVYWGGDWYSLDGTSFDAPQINGVFGLMTEQFQGRVGFPNAQLYDIFRRLGYGSTSPFKPVTTGTNLFYQASSVPGYNPATGIGTLDFDKLSKAMAP